MFSGDLSDAGVTTISGDFDAVNFLGASTGEAADGYSVSALSTNSYGALNFNTSDGTFTFTIDRAAVFASGSDQTVSFSIVGSDGGSSDSDTVVLNLLICVVQGTLIKTDKGQKPVETLRSDDLVWTLDDGFQPIRWIGSRHLSTQELRNDIDLRPIKIAPGALGNDKPKRGLRVSPQHRVLLSDWRAQLYFGQDEVLAPAKGLLNDLSFTRDHSLKPVTYFHILFDQHQIIKTNNALTESFCPGPHSLDTVAPETQAELFQLFPQLAQDRSAYGPAARTALKMTETKMLGSAQYALAS